MSDSQRPTARPSIIRTRDPETLEMEYAIGFKAREAKLFLELIGNEQVAYAQDEISPDVERAFERIKDRLQWVIDTAAADEQAAADRTADELP